MTDDGIEKVQLEASKNRMFTKEMLAFFATTNIDDARQTSYQLERFEFPEGGGDVAPGEFSEQRCKFCHQPIKHPIRIEAPGNLGIIGSDCARKFVQFQETGRVMSVTQTMRKENRVFKEVFDDVMAMDKNNILSREENTKRKNVLFASMLTWSKQKVESDPEGVSQAVRRALHEIDIFGAPLGPDGAQEFLTWYIETRTLNPEGILTKEEKGLFATHPHKEMLQKVLEKNPQKNIRDSQRIVRIIRHYKEPIDVSREIMSALIEEGIVFTPPWTQDLGTETYYDNARKKEMIYTLTKAFNGRFPREYALKNPEFIPSPVRKGYESNADIYAYEKPLGSRMFIDATPPVESSWVKGSQFLEISRLWLGRNIYHGVLHRCHTVAMTEYGRIEIMDGEKIVSKDITEYLKAQGVELIVRTGRNY